MRHTTERQAWLVLWAALITFCVLIITIPTGGYWFIRNATSNQSIVMTRDGTVEVLRPGRTTRETNLDSIPVESTIFTGPSDQATLNFLSPNGLETLGFVRIFGNTQVTITRADSPRFASWGVQPNRIGLSIATGSVQVFSSQEANREMEIVVASPPNVQTLINTRGSNVQVEATLVKTIATVREGDARITSGGASLAIPRNQRAEATSDQPPSQPLPAERDLIRNGDFQESLDQDWKIEIQSPAVQNESPGDVRSIVTEGRHAIHFVRVGGNWSQVGITQVINQDVRSFKSLRLRMEVLLSFQDLNNCGLNGTECPMMIRILYTDTTGAEREWVQGFFLEALYNPNPVFGFSSCVPCIPRNEHQQWPTNQWKQYDSQNLLDAFNAVDRPAVVIKSITIYASGHTYDSKVTQIQLLAE